MKLTRMKKWIFIFIAARFFVSGLEEFIIVPTAWVYVRSFGQSEAFLALVLSTYSIGYIAFSPVFGLLSDRLRYPKIIIVICHLSRLCGNALYSVPVSPYCLLIGRFLCGISGGGESVLLGEAARTTDEEELAKVFVVFDGMYTLGASFGPALASILDFEVDIFGWKIDEGNSPGVMLALAWAVIVIISFYLPSSFERRDDSQEQEALAKHRTDIALGKKDFTPEQLPETGTEKEFGRSSQSGICQSCDEEIKILVNKETDNSVTGEGLISGNTHSSNLTEEVAKSLQFGKNKDYMNLKEPLALNWGIDDISGSQSLFEEIPLKGTREESCESSHVKKNKSREELFNEFLSRDGMDSCSEKEDLLGKIPSGNKCGIFCLFYLSFTSWFFACSTTFYTPLLSLELLHLSTLHVKLLFLNGSLFLILLYIVLYIASEYYQERSLLKFVVYLQIIPIIVLSILALFWNNPPFLLSYLLIVYVSLGVPYFSFTLSCSLLSKICPEDEISFYQGLCYSIGHCAFISGRVLPSLMLTKITLAIFSFGMAFMWIVGLFWLCVLYEKLVPDPMR